MRSTPVNVAVVFKFKCNPTGRLSSWKRFFIEGKLSLSLGGVILVLLSIVCSVGLYGYIGVPATLIIFEILPFLVS